MIDAPAAPDFASALARVGIRIGPDGSAHFTGSEDAARLREAIALGRPDEEE